MIASFTCRTRMQLPRRPELAFSPACSGASLSLGSALSAGQVGPPAMTSSLCLVQGFLSVYGEPGECLEGNFFFSPERTFRWIPFINQKFADCTHRSHRVPGLIGYFSADVSRRPSGQLSSPVPVRPTFCQPEKQGKRSSSCRAA